MGVNIHPTAVVDPKANLGGGVEIGPFCCVGPEVVLGDGVVLHSHVVVGGRTEIGPRTVIYPFASIGLPPQDLKYKGERSRLTIGANTIDPRIRHGQSGHRGRRHDHPGRRSIACSWWAPMWRMTATSATT